MTSLPAPAPGEPIRPGSVYVWEIDSPHACELLIVTEVTWNGEEWMIRTEPLHPSLVNTTYPRSPAGCWNDLSRCYPMDAEARERLYGLRDGDAEHAPAV